MTTKVSEPFEIQMVPGCQPSTDRTAFSTGHSTFSDKIRWFQGVPQKISGWQSVAFDYGASVSGNCRRVFSAFLATSSTLITALGTNQNLYALSGTRLTNITPFVSTLTTIASSLSSDYRTLGNNPFTTANGSNIITVSDAFTSQYNVGDTFVMAGAVGFNGITAGMLNATQVIRSINYGANTYTIQVSGTANANGSGGGAACVFASGLITANATAHGMTNGQRVQIGSAATFAGIPAANINGEFIVRKAATNYFGFMSSAVSTSNVTNGGGTVTTYRPQIPAGLANETAAAGYGAGYYGVGLYGTGLISPSGRQFPRIWYIDRFQGAMIVSPGSQGGLYSWTGSTTTAPQPLGQQFTGTLTSGSAVITSVSTTLFLAVGQPLFGQFIPNGATIASIGSGTVTMSANTTLTSGATTETVLAVTSPQAVNYAFVSNDIVVTFGYQGVANQIFASDQTNIQNWVASSSNQVFQDTISGAGPLISHLPVSGTNLIFTDSRTYVFTYIGLPLIWSIALLDGSVGIIAPMARCTVNGVAYWMGKNNFYRWRGGNVEIIPANSQLVSTILNYVYSNLTSSQRSKIFAWYNERYGEVWFHYPSAQANEPDRVARVNVNENFIWTPDTFDRSAAEYPDILGTTPRLISSGGTLYNHESGTDADGSPMPFSLVSNLRFDGKKSKYVSSVVPDSVQTGNITLTITGYQFPQSQVPVSSKTYTITPTTEFMPTDVGGRFWQYQWAGAQLGQQWIAGKWLEYLQEGSMQ